MHTEPISFMDNCAMEENRKSASGLRWLVWFGALLGLGLRIGGTGWLIIIYWYLWPALTALHLVVNIRAIAAAGNNVAHIRPYVIASQLLFIVAMLLQIDVGDGPVWMVGPALVGYDLDYDRWGEHIGLLQWNVLVFLPCLLAWVAVAIAAGRARDAG